MDKTYDVIVLGAGAAGMMAAATAGQRGRRVLLLEAAEKPGKKILISGGGRCNFTNLHTAPDRYLSKNPHFAKSALGRYSPLDFLSLVESYNIAWHEKTLGQLFCDGSARQIVAMLVAECEKAKLTGGAVELRCDAQLSAVSQKDGLFRVDLDGNAEFAPALVIATGGPSIPKMGATPFAYELARQFGLKVVEPRPALVPLTLHGDDVFFRELSGVSAEVVVRCGKVQFREAALFTHRGLSGPAILQISSYWRPGEEIGINFLPGAEPGWLLEAKRTKPKTGLRNVLGSRLADRLAAVLASQLGLERDLGNVSDKLLLAAEARLRDWRFMPNGSEGFAKAEVTLGGISTSELSSKTMEALRVPGLYAIGEAVDVTGWLGGYNFQWAWASGWAAGQAV